MLVRLQSIHLYRKVPRDLTDATRTGGALSLACAGLMLYLFISNIAAYMKMTTSTDVVLDDTGDRHMRLFFNITMVRNCGSKTNQTTHSAAADALSACCSDYGGSSNACSSDYGGSSNSNIGSTAPPQ